MANYEICIDKEQVDKARFYTNPKTGKVSLIFKMIEKKSVGQYGDTHFITQPATKEERDARINTPIIGNVKPFSAKGAAGGHGNNQSSDLVNDDIPF